MFIKVLSSSRFMVFDIEQIMVAYCINIFPDTRHVETIIGLYRKDKLSSANVIAQTNLS